MKIFEFTDSFVVLKDIRTVMIRSQKVEPGINDENEDENHRCFIKIIYNNDSSFKAHFSSRGEAKIVYYKLISSMKGQDIDDAIPVQGRSMMSGIPL